MLPLSVAQRSLPLDSPSATLHRSPPGTPTPWRGPPKGRFQGVDHMTRTRIPQSPSDAVKQTGLLPFDRSGESDYEFQVAPCQLKFPRTIRRGEVPSKQSEPSSPGQSHRGSS